MADYLLIRADASASIGTGHVMRCLALAQAWQEMGGKAIFVVAMDIDTLAKHLQSEGIDVVRLQTKPGSLDDAAQTATLAVARRARCIVIDGYHFDTNYQRAVKQYDSPVLYLDDAGYAGEFAADFIMNQNISAHEGLYPKRPAGARLLLGPQYALLRREFWSYRGRPRTMAKPPRNLLVTLGGSDPDNVTLIIIRTLRQLGQLDLNVRIVIGACNPHGDSLRREMAHLPGRYELLVNTSEMPQLMNWADVAIAAGGSTCWELTLMGLPMLVMILADNQSGIAEGLASHGVAINLGWHNLLKEATVARTLTDLLLDEKRRQEMSRRGQKLVDGFGAARVAKILKEKI